MPIINFTPGECAALLHRLECADAISDVFNDTDGLEGLSCLVDSEANDIARQLTNYGHVVFDDTTRNDPHLLTRRAVLIEAVAGSTWVGVHDNAETSLQKMAAARRSLITAAAKIEAALGLEPHSIAIPEA